MKTTTQGSGLWRFGSPVITQRGRTAKRDVGGHDLNLNRQSVNPEGGSSSLKIEWLTSDEAAAYLKVSVGELRNKVWNKTLRAHHMGRRLRFLVSDLNSLLVPKGAKNGN